MSSSFSTLSDSLLMMLSSILDTLDQLHTVSIEFTVLRHKGLPTGLEMHLQCLLAEQKSPKELVDPNYTNKELENNLKEHEKQLRQTVS